MSNEMLTNLCQELRNYFLRDRDNDIHDGTFTVSGGAIEPLSFLQDGQYYRIVGSVFNDGVHKYGGTPPETLTDETFDGAIWAMSVPPAILALAEEIETWTENNAETIASPFVSESFGGYSYSKGYSGGSSNAVTWQNQFAVRLKQWRRISIL